MIHLNGSYLSKQVVIITKTGSTIRGTVKHRDKNGGDKLVLRLAYITKEKGSPEYQCESAEIDLVDIETIGLLLP